MLVVIGSTGTWIVRDDPTPSTPEEDTALVDMILSKGSPTPKAAIR